MQIHPLVTVKKAASVLGMDKETIRGLLVAGEIPGEKRRVGSKDKWFIYHGAVESLLEKRLQMMDQSDRMSLEGLNEFFEPVEPSEPEQLFGDALEEQSAAPDFALAEELLEPEKPAQKGKKKNKQKNFEQATPAPEEVPAEISLAVTDSASQEPAAELEFPVTTVEKASRPEQITPAYAEYLPALDEIIQSLTQQFTLRLAEDQKVIFSLEQELAEKDLLLKRLPDLEQQMRSEQSAIEEKDSELRSMRLHITALENELKQSKRPWWKRWLSVNEA